MQILNYQSVGPVEGNKTDADVSEYKYFQKGQRVTPLGGLILAEGNDKSMGLQILLVGLVNEKERSKGILRLQNRHCS